MVRGGRPRQELGTKAEPCQPVHVAVLGTGSIGMRHLKVLRQMGNVQPIAVPKRRGRERIRFLKEAGYVTALDLEEAVRKGATHCIIATDTGQHVRDGLIALENGLDILSEKPLATSALEASHLTERAKDAGRGVFVGCVLRYSESLNTFRESLEDVGRLHSVRIECQSYLPDWHPQRPYKELYSVRPGEGGVLLDLIHEIDYAGWLFGWPGSVQARVKNLGHLDIPVDEVAELSWETPQGCIVSINLDYLTRPPRRRMRACSEKGTIEWDGIARKVTLMLSGAPTQEFKTNQTRDEMLLEQNCAFVDTINGNCDPRLASSEEGVKALAVCDAARRASDSRREEAVEYL